MSSNKKVITCCNTLTQCGFRTTPNGVTDLNESESESGASTRKEARKRNLNDKGTSDKKTYNNTLTQCGFQSPPKRRNRATERNENVSSLKKPRKLNYDPASIINVDEDNSENADEEDEDDELEYDLDEENLMLLTQQFTQEKMDSDDESDDDDTESPSFDYSNILSQQPLDEVQYTQPSQNASVKVVNYPNSDAAAFKDTEEQVFYEDPTRSEGLLIFKINEAYHKRRAKTINTHIFVIKKFKVKDGKKYAVCTVYQLRASTFIGNSLSESENLKQEKYIILNHQCDWHLSQLGKRIEKPPTGLSTASIYYECNRKDDRKDKNDTAKSFGFNILYTLKSKKKCFLSSEVPTILEIFAGCGGMSQGFKKAGFDVKWAVEKDHHAVSTFMINHPEVDMFNECVRTWFEKVKRKPEMYSHIKPDHIHFSSPCQGFSRANRNGGRNDEANNNLSLFCIDIVAHFLPKTISFENVTGMAHGSNIKYLQDIVASFVDMGYSTRVQILDSSRYGDPQKRSRVIITAAQSHLQVAPFPKPTHGPSNECVDVVSTWEALDSLEHLSPEEGNGSVRMGNDKTTMNHSREGTTLKTEMVELNVSEPASTLRRKANVKHYNLNRCLTVREMARLFSFDDSFRFFGPPLEQINQIGNAVPVNLATAVAQGIRNTSYPLS